MLLYRNARSQGNVNAQVCGDCYPVLTRIKRHSNRSYQQIIWNYRQKTTQQYPKQLRHINFIIRATSVDNAQLLLAYIFYKSFIYKKNSVNKLCLNAQTRQSKIAYPCMAEATYQVDIYLFTFIYKYKYDLRVNVIHCLLSLNL